MLDHENYLKVNKTNIVVTSYNHNDLFCPTTQKVEFMLSHLAYRATVYKTGVGAFDNHK